MMRFINPLKSKAQTARWARWRAEKHAKAVARTEQRLRWQSQTVKRPGTFADQYVGK